MVNLFKSFKAMIFFTVLLGLIYPFFIMSTGYVLMENQATGSQVYYDGKLIGSELIAQQMPKSLFQERPSASNYNPLETGGTNYAVNNEAQLKIIKSRVNRLVAKYGSEPIPEDLVFASASGVDPDISAQAAMYQAEYVANQNNISLEKVKDLIKNNTLKHFFGVNTVNVLNLNLELLELIKRESKKSFSLI